MKKRLDTISRPALRALVLLCAAVALSGLMYLAGCAAEGGALAGSVIPETGEFTAAFIDVGQGDAVLISCGGQHMLIDAGTAQGGEKVIGHLQARGIERLDLVAATHPHADHIGGMAAVLDTFGVGTFVMPEAAHTTKTFEDMLDAVERNGCDAQYASAGQIYWLGEAQVTVLWPQAGAFEGSNLNNASLVLSVQYDDVYLLLMGDAEAEVEQALLADGIGGFHLLKAGHHGSRTSSSQDFLDAVAWDHVVISCGAGNDYGHPHGEVLDRLAENRVWRTDTSGTVTATVEGGVLSVSTQR